MRVIVELDGFSGPLDLLLYLIRKEEMDIFDINIQEITKQYLDSIKQMKKLNLEAAGEFVAMAATLIQIKAKMLVPQYNEEGEVIEDADPRKDLVRRLIEYQMYQDAGKRLYERPLLGRDLFLRGRRENIQMPEGEVILEEENALYALIASYRGAVRRMKKAVHKVAKSLKSIRERIMEIRVHLKVGQRVLMSSLLEQNAEDHKGNKLITFLSLLELGKLGLVSLFQSENFADIHIEANTEINEDVIAKVENYDAAHGIGDNTEIWLQEEELAATGTDDMQANLFVQPHLADGEPAVEAATDEEILAEEQRLEENHYEPENKDIEI